MQNGLLAIGEVLRLFLSPVSPYRWWIYARRINQGYSWGPPMFLFASFGMALTIHVGIGAVAGANVLPAMQLLTWLSWLVVGSISTGMVVTSSMRNLSRFMLSGIGRPNWWFQWARISWILFLYATISCAGSKLLGRNHPAFTSVGGVLLIAAAYFFLSFFAVASMGFLISFVRKIPRCGRAYDCVHYFYTIIGGMVLMSISIVWWPPAKIWPNGTLVVAIGLAGLILLAGGFISTVLRHEKFRHSPDLPACE